MASSFEVELGEIFKRQARQLSKKYGSVSFEINALVKQLEADPWTGAKSLGKNCYKIRMAIASKGKGKSGGARVITYIKVIDNRVVLLSIYDKSEKEDLQPGELEDLLSQAGLD